MITEMLLDRGLVPDALIRFQIRKLLRERLKEESGSNQDQFIQTTKSAPIAVETKSANDQHYEVPAAFFEKVLGPRLKYSCAFFDQDADTLASAEEKMLALTCKRAELQDNQMVLELGCGWGSLTLWMAEKYPNSKIVGVSNSSSQKEFIMAQAKSRGFKNISILTCDMNVFETDILFDRVVSVEMFEHMRNVSLLLSKIESWLKPEGKLFVHIFSHKNFSYLYEDKNSSDWMARHFFTGGMMPSHDLYKHFDENLKIEESWIVPGTHYSQTAKEWLRNMDLKEREIKEIFRQTYGKGTEKKWWTRWRVFFMACDELWGFRGGHEWQVSHYRFKKSRAQ